MFVIPSLSLKGFEDVAIPSASELFRIYGGRVGNVSFSCSDPHDYSNPVNGVGYSKVDMLSAGLTLQRQQQYDVYQASLPKPEDTPAD